MKIFSAAGALCFCLLFSSCQKEDDKPSKTGEISSSPWVHESSGIDTDKNGTIDISLLMAGVPECRLDNVLTFRADGSATAGEGATKCNTSDPATTNFNWSFTDNETTLNLSGNVFAQLNGSFKIKTLNSTNFSLTRDTVITAPVRIDATIIVNLKH
ncbi:hypothetical protein HRG84_16340 [Flavisolibacter sp. BT320]|nr:hypothetical protein [Flavisolibacter longurius]